MNRAPSPSDSCPGCGIRYARFMPGQWGSSSDRRAPSSGKRHAWAEHIAHCGAPVRQVKSNPSAAEDFLREQLALGAAPAREIEQAAFAMGYSRRTLHRAKRLAGVVSRRYSNSNRGQGEWLWSLDDCPF